jgi:hypothetical protein
VRIDRQSGGAVAAEHAASNDAGLPHAGNSLSTLANSVNATRTYGRNGAVWIDPPLL